MSVINRYMGLSFLKNWGYALAFFMLLYTCIDFLEKIGDFLAHNVPVPTIALFFAAQLPKLAVMMSPVASLVAVTLTLAVMARNSEIVAFKAGGVSLYRLSAPILSVSLGLCLAMFLMSDVVAPRATAAANKIWQGQVKERLETSAVAHNVWLKGVRRIQHLDSYDESDGSMTGVSLIFFNEDGSLARRIEAARGQLAGGELFLRDVMEKVYLPPDGAARAGALTSFTVSRHQVYIIGDWPAPPAGLGKGQDSSEEMSVAQLWRAIDRLAAEGFGPTRQRVDLQFKFSFALLSLIMVVVGLPLGFWRERGGGAAISLTLGLFLSFLYLIAMELARSLGYSGLLPPLAAAWLPNAVFLLLGAYLFSYVRQ